MKDKAIILDANSMLYRAYYIARNIAKKKEEFPEYGVFLIRQLFKLVRSMCASLLKNSNYKYAVAIFDTPESKYRHQQLDAYKSNRLPRPEILVKHDHRLKRVISDSGYVLMDAPIPYEADDAVASLSKVFASKGIEVEVISSDRDLLQVVDKDISVVLYKGKGKQEKHTYTNFKELNSNLLPYQIIHKKALAGDQSDNYKGAKGIGDLTAVKLLLKYDTVQGLYDNIDSLKESHRATLIENREYVELCLSIAEVKLDLPLSGNLEDYLRKEPIIQEIELGSNAEVIE